MLKKLVGLILVLILAFSLVSCGGGGDNSSSSGNNQIEIPDYDAKSDLTFTISSWYSPKITSEILDLYIEAGFNEIMLQGLNVGGLLSTTKYDAALLCEQKKLPYYLVSENQLNDLTVFSEKFDGLEYFKGIDVYDEPLIYDGYTTLGNATKGLYTIANYVEPFEEAYTDKNFFVNLHPVEAAGVQFEGNYKNFVNVTCEEVLAKITEGERWLSADSYPIRKGNYLKANWLANLGYLAEAKYVTHKDLGLKTNFYIQSIKGGGEFHRDIGYEELSLQLYTLMAFGFDSANYYCFGTPPGNGYALVDPEGNLTTIYDAAKRINHELNAFDHVYMQFNSNWKGVIPVLGTLNKDEYNESFDFLTDYVSNATTSVKIAKNIKSITAEYDTIVGVMQDEYGNPGFMVVNYNDTSHGYEGDVTFTFDNAQKALVYRHGEALLVEVANNTLTLPMGVGEGVFVIPFGA